MTMTDKAYIVANKTQELDVLKKFEQKYFVWSEGENPTDWLPSEKIFYQYNVSFPYVISSNEDNNIIWFNVAELENETIVYDGRN